jgi:1-pyrroline-5-carboxylate dehydrogenase
VAIITPYNFPIEIPVLQVMGALFMGNRPLLKVDSKVSVVMEQFLRLLHACGLPAGDVDFINTDGPTMNKLLVKAQPRMTLFTGCVQQRLQRLFSPPAAASHRRAPRRRSAPARSSSRVAEKLARDLAGKIKIEDAGFDWKILGPDVAELPYVAWQADQDAYACSGQKCSAQSLLFAHRAWVKAGFFDEMARLASRRTLADLTAGPVLTWTTAAMRAHIDALLAIPGARLLFGGGELAGHTIPACYGALEPTAVFVPLRQLRKKRYFGTATTEVFGPVQVVTEYRSRDIDAVLDVTERLDAALTAAVVSNDETFRNYVLSRTVNGTTYGGIRARTTGAPQNHWFGPSGDPRGAGIGTKEAIQLVWSAHREVIDDVGPVPADWAAPPPS